MPTRVMIMGLGPIGAGVARQLAARKNFRIVSAVDIDPAKAGKDLGEVVGLGKKTGVKVGADPVAAIRKTKPQVAVLCTSSALKKVWPQVEAVLKLKVPIVSTTEELVLPLVLQQGPGAEDRRRGEEGEGGGGRHRGEPRLRHGRAAHRPHRDLRAGGRGARRPHPGRAHPPPALPAEDRLRPHPRGVRGEGEDAHRAPRRPHRVGGDDRRRAWAGSSTASPTRSSRRSPRPRSRASS